MGEFLTHIHGNRPPREHCQAYAAAHEYDDPNDVAHAHQVVAEVAKSVSLSAPAMVIDKFPKGLTQKHLGTGGGLGWRSSACRVYTPFPLSISISFLALCLNLFFMHASFQS